MTPRVEDNPEIPVPLLSLYTGSESGRTDGGDVVFMRTGGDPFKGDEFPDRPKSVASPL